MLKPLIIFACLAPGLAHAQFFQALPSSGGGGGVSSFMTRAGAVSLLAADVSTALGYAPQSAGQVSAAITASVPGLATTTVAGLVRPDGTTVTIANGVISSVGGGSTAFTRAAYTASGAISTANTLAVMNGSAGTLAMTLANGTADGQPILIKQLGTAAATVTATIDGASQTVALAAGSAGTVRDALKLRWSTADTSWLVE